MGKTPVTNREYDLFLKAHPQVDPPAYWGDRRFNQAAQPVVGISWDDAKKYAAWAGLRLPSEAEWEYACRAGTDTVYASGNDEKALGRAGWYRDNSDGRLHPVGEKDPNGFGLYDMHGNVWEWVEDDWHQTYDGAPGDGSPWIDTPRAGGRVDRGGGWTTGPGFCRSATRSNGRPGDRYDFLGFRLAAFLG